MISFSNKYRSTQSEIMDNFDWQGTEMGDLLNDLKRVNRWLGGNNITLNGVSKLLVEVDKSKEITIVDIGCGDGEMLRQCASFAKRHGYNFQCIGLDFNENILKIADRKSKSFPNIKFQKTDILDTENSIPNCDIALSTLFLHHFSNERIEFILKKILEKAKIGAVVNDLQRSQNAFQLFKVASEIFLKTRTAKHDGLVSIARGFKKNELLDSFRKNPKSTKPALNGDGRIDTNGCSKKI